MSHPRFIYAGTLSSGEEIELSSEEAHHLAHVMRLPSGAAVEIVNGRGQFGEGTVLKVGASGARVRLGAVIAAAAGSRVEVIFGVPKPPAMEFILRRATEIGVAGFRPLVTRHSLRLNEWNERRWGKIILEVCKQCQELRFPQLHPPQPLAQWLAQRDPNRLLVLFDETDRAARAAVPADAAGLDLLTGPEGGWSPEELALFRSAGAISYGLGRNRLRAEMAAVIGTALIKKELGEI